MVAGAVIGGHQIRGVPGGWNGGSARGSKEFLMGNLARTRSCEAGISIHSN
jgi:hypothetical protein